MKKAYCLKWWDEDFEEHIEGYFSTKKKALSALNYLQKHLGCGKLKEEEYETEPISYKIEPISIE